jgi:hypothetical protein
MNVGMELGSGASEALEKRKVFQVKTSSNNIMFPLVILGALRSSRCTSTGSSIFCHLALA